MPTLIIDNRSVTVPEGTNVLEAAKRLGIVIPHFCYHEALGSVGACRLCAMKFLDGPVKGIQMACMIPAKDGMVVSTLDDEATAYRAQVIEWLMMNHPHDCPVCDEGGECQLQDMTIAGGHGIRRYTGKKRTYLNQDLGPFVVQEMNRCIQCYRCVRTYQDYCGGTDFGVMGVNQRLFFGRFREGPLDSPFAGNIIDACPTGVFTSKPFRFKTRFWDLEEGPSICPHCSLGCAVIPGARYRELQRVRAGVNKTVNGWFICDRGRFGYGYVNHPDRPRDPLVAGNTVKWEAALDLLRSRLDQLIARHGAGAIALLGSGRAGLEANFLLKEWGERLGAPDPVFSSHSPRDRAARALVGLDPELRASLADVRASDLIVVLGADPVAEGPSFALALRQAVRNGGRVVVLDPRPVRLPCAAEHLPCQPEELPELIASLTDPETAGQTPAIRDLAVALQQARRPVLSGGCDLLGEGGLRQLLAAAEKLSTKERPCRAFALISEANSFGAALLAQKGPTFDQVMTGIEEGRIKALVCLEADPLGDCPEPHRASQALAKLEFLALFDYLPTATAGKADLLLPTTAMAESDGFLLNNEGRMLPFQRVFQPGLPIRISGEGNHPPRTFALATPGDRPRQAWAVLANLLDRPEDLGDVHRRLIDRDPRFSGLEDLRAGGEGRPIKVGVGSQTDPPPPSKNLVDGWRLLSCQSLYGSEPLSRLSPALAPVLPEPRALLHSNDARALHLAEGDRIRLYITGQEILLPVELCDNMAEKLVIVPHLRGTSLENFHPGTGPVACRVEKASGS
jgi:NADH-quinone oxidoreductase subunit G